ncbi:MAG: AMP-binding protein, partial [Cyanobacteria bacterium P01_A01_bin.114]
MPSISPPSLSLTSVQQSEPAALTTAQIAAALLRQETVIDCVVRYRSVNVPSAPPQFLAYVVLSVAFDQAAVQARLQETLGATLAAAVRLISVTRIPLTAEGNVDEAILSKLPLIDATLAQRWSTCLTSQPEVRQAATMVEARPSPLTHLHLADLLPAEQLGLLSAQGEAQSAPPLPRSEPQGEVTSQVPAISHGEPLQPIASMPTNLAQALRQTAQRFPTHGVTYLQNDGTDRVQPYPELLAEAERILGGLQRLNLEPKTKLIFQFDSNQDYIPAFWACMLGGFVPVPIAIAPAYEPDNAVVQKLCNAWQHLDKPIVLTNESVAPGLRSLIQQLGLEAFTLQTIETLQPGGAVLPEGDSSQPEDLAVLLLTSGSTGRPKGVMLTHQNILSNVAASAQVNQFTAQDISLNWLRLDHVGSLVRCCIRDVYVGSQQIHAPAEQVLDNPLRLLDWIERYQVTFAWAPNFALGLINDRAPEIQQRQWNLTSLRSMLSVAEAIVPKTAQRFADLLAPHGFTPEMMHSAWGMSETCAAVTFSHRYLLNLTSPNASSVEVGAPTAGFQMRIVDAQDRVLSEETVG